MWTYQMKDVSAILVGFYTQAECVWVCVKDDIVARQWSSLLVS